MFVNKGGHNMLCSYKLKNFCSFGELGEFDMVASPTRVRNRFPGNFVESKTGMLPLKTMVIVGENAGGKSNFINSLMYLKTLFIDNRPVRSIKRYVNTNKLCDEEVTNCDTKQMFELKVDLDDCIYTYHLEIDFLGIVQEKLCFTKKKGNAIKEVLTVIRKGEDVEHSNDEDNINNLNIIYLFY